MMVATGKEIRNFILDPTNDLDELFDLITENSQNVIDGILSALYKLLLRNYEQNKSRSDYLIYILDNMIDEFSNEELKFLNIKIDELNNNIVNNIKKKQRVLIREPINKLNDIHNKAAEKIISDIKNSKIKLLEYLIFQEKNLYLIEKTLANNPNLLIYRNKDGADIFTVVLEKYLYLSEKDSEEIDYLYNVILLFIESPSGSIILNNVKKYQRIIKNKKIELKEHIIKVIELFDKNFSISLEELEERYNVKFSFPNIVYNEINTFVMDNNERVNFTNQKCITIDGANDRCLDDALYIEKNDDGTHNLYIHIADIPSFVSYNSATDEEARKRIETQYLRDCNITLYPDMISDVICSLLPNNNRNVITSIYKLDENYNLISDIPIIVKGKIRTVYKLSYEEVDKRIKNPLHDELDVMLSELFLFSLKQKESNPDKELYRILENYIEFEEHHESLKVDYSPSANIVHEAMVLNNYGISKYLKSLDLPYLYRQLYIPTESFINDQINKIKSLDEKIENNKSFRNTLRDSYIKATYTDVPVRHKGLNLECYSHSSSPLRRYADAHGQYIIHDFIFNNRIDDLNIQLWEYRTKELAKYLNSRKQENENFSKHYNYLSYKKLIKKK